MADRVAPYRTAWLPPPWVAPRVTGVPRCATAGHRIGLVRVRPGRAGRRPGLDLVCDRCVVRPCAACGRRVCARCARAAPRLYPWTMAAVAGVALTFGGLSRHCCAAHAGLWPMFVLTSLLWLACAVARDGARAGRR